MNPSSFGLLYTNYLQNIQLAIDLLQEPGSKPSAAAGSEPAKKKRKPTKKTANSEVSFENTFDKKKLNVEILSFKVQ